MANKHVAWLAFEVPNSLKKAVFYGEGADIDTARVNVINAAINAGFVNRDGIMEIYLIDENGEEDFICTNCVYTQK